MKLTTKDCCIITNPTTGKHYFNMTLPTKVVDKLQRIVGKEGLKSIDIKSKSNNRTLSANALMWVMISKISKLLATPKGDLYIRHIKDYGQFTNIIIKQELLTSYIKSWNIANTEVQHTESLCEVTNTFRKGSQVYSEVLCHYGSSCYDKEEFSKLLNGIIESAKDLGIDTMDPRELQSIIESYGDQWVKTL